MNQEWFEMADVRRRRLDAAVWVPLRAVQKLSSVGQHGHAGFKEEFFGAGTIAVPLSQRGLAETLTWSDVGISYHHQPYVEGDEYWPADLHRERSGLAALRLALEQRGNNGEPRVWHLHQDLVIGLALKREGDLWLAQDEGYEPAARLSTGVDGSPVLLEVKAEFLKDYLAARQMALYVSSYRRRVEVREDASDINWGEESRQENGLDRWEGRVSAIHEGGMPFGASTAVFHAARTDVDPEEDVPTLGPPSDDNIRSSSWTKTDSGRKLHRISGELWRREWVEPALRSPRVRGDRASSTVSFVIDAAGAREIADALKEEGRWLWFRPDVMVSLAHRRGGGLAWYSRDTGGVCCSPDYTVHFGVNGHGFVTVYAKDIALLPEWQQRIWAGYNVTPEGGVSTELLASQVDAEPAETQAAEEYLPRGLELLNQLTKEKYGFALFREHADQPTILERSHRFRATDKAGLFSLAKDLARLTADSIDASAIQRVAVPPKGTKWGSLKSLENLIALTIGDEQAHKLMAPLFGIFELRHADAHLGGSGADNALALSGVDSSLPYVHQGRQLLETCVETLYVLADVLKRVVPQNSN